MKSVTHTVQTHFLVILLSTAANKHQGACESLVIGRDDAKLGFLA